MALACLALSGPVSAGAPADATVGDRIERGLASFYGKKFQGRRTSSGERFDHRRFTAASNRFPLGSRVAVRRPDNGLCAIVRINDRMHTRHRQRILDLSRSVGDYLEMLSAGVVPVEAVLLGNDVAVHDLSACSTAFAASPVGESGPSASDDTGSAHSGD